MLGEIINPENSFSRIFSKELEKDARPIVAKDKMKGKSSSTRKNRKCHKSANLPPPELFKKEILRFDFLFDLFLIINSIKVIIKKGDKIVKKLSRKKFKKILLLKLRELLNVFMIVEDCSDFKLRKIIKIKGENNAK